MNGSASSNHIVQFFGALNVCYLLGLTMTSTLAWSIEYFLNVIFRGDRLVNLVIVSSLLSSSMPAGIRWMQNSRSLILRLVLLRTSSSFFISRAAPDGNLMGTPSSPYVFGFPSRSLHCCCNVFHRIRGEYQTFIDLSGPHFFSHPGPLLEICEYTPHPR